VDDVRDELRSGWGGESRQDWWGPLLCGFNVPVKGF